MIPSTQRSRCRRINPQFLFLASLLLACLRVQGFTVHRCPKQSSFGVPTRLWKARKDRQSTTMEAPNTNKRKKKKNKYANFSKADKIELDPLEALVQESEQKLKSMEQEKEEAQKAKRETLPPPPEGSTKKLEFPNNKDIDPYDPTTFGFVEIGTVRGPHGVHGWVKVKGSTDFPERLTRAGMPLHMKAARKRAPRKVTLAAGKFLGDDEFLVQLQGYYDRSESETLKGSTLYYATQQDSVKEDDDVILSELVGLSVYKIADEENNETENRLVGTILGVVLAEEMCAIPGLLHDQIEVGVTRDTSDPNSPQDLLLIPLVPEIVPKIDLENQMILVDPPAGLLDLTYVREEKVKIKGLLAPAKE